MIEDGQFVDKATAWDKLAEKNAEITRLRALFEDACKVFDHYDLPEHAMHYRREALGMTPRQALAPYEQKAPPSSGGMDQGGISDRLGNFDDWGNRIKDRS